MKNFLSLFAGGLLGATVFLSPLQAMDELEEGLFSSLPNEHKTRIKTWAVYGNNKARALPCVCKAWEACYNQDKWRKVTITPDQWSDTLPKELESNPFVRSLTLGYDIMKVADFGKEFKETQDRNLRNYIQLQRVGLCNKPLLKTLILEDLAVGNWTENSPLDPSPQLLDSEGLFDFATYFKEHFPKKPWVQCLKNLKTLKIEHMYALDWSAAYFRRQVITPENYPNLEEVSWGGAADERFQEKALEPKK